MKKIYVHGSYFGNNYGDVLLVDLFSKHIKELGYTPIFPFASDFYKASTSTEVGVLNNNDDVIAGVFCGGGYFGEPSKNKLLWSLRNNYRHKRAYDLFKKNKIKYGIFGAGFGPITFNPFKSTASDIVRNASKVIFRDNESCLFAKEYAGDIDLSSAADVVISLDSKMIPVESSLLAEAFLTKQSKTKKFIAIHITDKYKNKNNFKFIKEALSKLSKELMNDFHFIFISDGKSSTQRKLRQEVDIDDMIGSFPKGCFTKYNYTSHWDLTAVLQKMDVVITSKLHVGIVSTALGVNVISIPYHSKTIRFYDQMNSSDRCLMDFSSSDDVYDHLYKFIGHDAIDIPIDILESSKSVFTSINKFINNI